MVRPRLQPSLRSDELDIHAQHFTLRSKAAMEHITHAKFLADSEDIDRPAFELLRALARDDTQPRNTRQNVDEVVRDHFGGYAGLLIVIIRDRSEWQHRNGNGIQAGHVRWGGPRMHR